MTTQTSRSPQYPNESAEPAVDVESITFNPHAPELTYAWFNGAESIVCVNAYPNGVTVSLHKNESTPVTNSDGEVVRYKQKYLPQQFHLRIKDMRDYLLPRGKYLLYREGFRDQLEQQFSQLHQQGKLERAVVYFGTTTDPFLSLGKKFDVTMGCMAIFEKYRPGFMVAQTRSPMAIAALPMLKSFGEKAVVSMPIESRLESAVARYTPGMPRLSERLVAADGLRTQGVKVNLMASPLLPYGEYYRDAREFANLLDAHSDYITVGGFATGRSEDEATLKALPVAKRLAADKQFRMLRPHSYRYLFYALQSVAPEKLKLPVRDSLQAAQMDLFAA